jgi:cell wall-associated NlpC family hydrolase
VSTRVPSVMSTTFSTDSQQLDGLSVGFGNARGSSVLAIASRYLGVKYRYGGTSPIGWDCAGAMMYIYRQLGVNLPRTANQQMQASQPVARSEARPGDLVFMVSGGAAYHVGSYAGGNKFWDAGRTGRSFGKREIFSSNVVFGRVL